MPKRKTAAKRLPCHCEAAFQARPKQSHLADCLAGLRPSRNDIKLGKVYLVGAGPGDPSLVTLRGAALLKDADAVIADKLVNPKILEWARKAEKQIVTVTHSDTGDSLTRKIFAQYRRKDQERINRSLVRFAGQGKKVVRLKGGDPFMFGRGGEEALYLAQHKIPFEIVPGVTAGLGAPAYAGIPVTDRRWASSVTFVTANEDPAKKDSSVDWKNLAKQKGTLVLFMGVKNLSKVCLELIRDGRSPRTLAAIIEWGTTERQKVVEGNLATISKKAIAAKIESPALTVIGEVNRFRKHLAWFEKKTLSGKTVVVTRPSAQAGDLSEALRSQGAAVLEYPAIQIKPPKDWEPVDRAIQRIPEFDWVIFTSVNGVRYFMNRVLELGKDARIFSKTKIAVLGEKTANELQRFTLRADLIPETFSSEGLIQALRAGNKILGKSFLLPRTDIAPEFLNRQLEKFGAQVTQVAAYRTLPGMDAEAKKKIRRWFTKDQVDFVTFTSSSTVDHFFATLPGIMRKKIKSRFVSIGPVTSQTLKKYGVKPFREAKIHTIPGIVEAMIHE